MVLLPASFWWAHFRASVVDGRGAPAGAGRRRDQGQGRRAGTADWPTRATQIGNCFKNQFELPLLSTPDRAGDALRHADLFIVVMSWVFVVTRFRSHRNFC